MKTTRKIRNENAKNIKTIQEKKFWTKKRKFLSLSLLSAIIFGIIIIFLFNKNDDRKNVERLLSRAKELINSLPVNEYDYGLRKVFPSAAVLSGSFEKGKWKIDTEAGKEYALIFILPKTQNDYERCVGLDRVIMATASSEGSLIPFLVVINPKQLRKEDMTGINFDYLASTMLHESIHVYQRSLLKRKGLELSSSDQASIAREKEAYTFQAKFIDKILFDNKIENRIIVPILSLEKQKQMTSDGLSNFCKEVDYLNKNKLGYLCTLVVFEAYPDMYAPLVTFNSISKY